MDSQKENHNRIQKEIRTETKIEIQNESLSVNQITTEVPFSDEMYKIKFTRFSENNDPRASVKAVARTLENKNKIARVHLLSENSTPNYQVLNLQTSQSIQDTLSASAVTTGQPWIQGFEFVWSDRSVSLIKDLSFAGITILGRGHIGKSKVGEPISARLRLPDGNYLPLQLVIHKISAEEIDFEFENPVAGRVIVEQSLKDQLISKNLRLLIPTKLYSQNKPNYWFHGPFDTNILIWTDADLNLLSEKTRTADFEYSMNVVSNIKKIILEYDHVVLIIDKQESDKKIFENQMELKFQLSLAKSQASCDLGQNYFSPLFDPKVSRVSLGATFIDRLVKVLQSESLMADKTNKNIISAVIKLIRNF